LCSQEKIDNYDFTIGMTLKAIYNPESREYNGRWYTELQIWKIEDINWAGVHKQNQAQTSAPARQNNGNAAETIDDDQLPF